MKKDVVIIGAGGFGRETAALIRDINQQEEAWNFLGFIDDSATGKTVEGYPILGTFETLKGMDPKPNVVIAIADSEIRERMVRELDELSFTFPVLIHPSVAVNSKVRIGRGSVVCRNVIFTTNVSIGEFCILNLNCSVAHDCVVGDYVSMMPHTAVAGEVTIGKACYFGVHSTVINRIKIVPSCIFGAGCTVVQDITEKGTYVGVPAKRVQ